MSAKCNEYEEHPEQAGTKVKVKSQKVIKSECHKYLYSVTECFMGHIEHQ